MKRGIIGVIQFWLVIWAILALIGGAIAVGIVLDEYVGEWAVWVYCILLIFVPISAAVYAEDRER